MSRLLSPPAPVSLAPVPMPAEVAEAHLQRIEHLLAELETSATALCAASWGTANDCTTSRHLPDGTKALLADSMQRIEATLTEVCELRDLSGWNT